MRPEVDRTQLPRAVLQRGVLAHLTMPDLARLRRVDHDLRDAVDEAPPAVLQQVLGNSPLAPALPPLPHSAADAAALYRRWCAIDARVGRGEVRERLVLHHARGVLSQDGARLWLAPSRADAAAGRTVVAFDLDRPAEGPEAFVVARGSTLVVPPVAGVHPMIARAEPAAPLLDPRPDPCWSPDGTCHLGVVPPDLWLMRSRHAPHAIHLGAVSGTPTLGWSPTSQHLAIAAQPQRRALPTVRIFAVATGAQVTALTGSEAAFSPDGSAVMVLTPDGVRILDVASGDTLRALPSGVEGTWLGRAGGVLYCDDDGAAWAHGRARPQPIALPPPRGGPTEPPARLHRWVGAPPTLRASSPDGRWALLGIPGATWLLQAGSPPRVRVLPLGLAQRPIWSPGSRRVLLDVRRDGGRVLACIDLTLPEAPLMPLAMPPHWRWRRRSPRAGQVRPFCPSGRYLALDVESARDASFPNGVALFAAEDGRLVAAFPERGSERLGGSARWSADGSRLATRSQIHFFAGRSPSAGQRAQLAIMRGMVTRADVQCALALCGGGGAIAHGLGAALGAALPARIVATLGGIASGAWMGSLTRLASKYRWVLAGMGVHADQGTAPRRL